MARKTSTVTCKYCQSKFQKEDRYILSAEKKNRQHFCCISHSALWNNENTNFGPQEKNLWTSENNGNAFKSKANPFRYFLRKAKLH